MLGKIILLSFTIITTVFFSSILIKGWKTLSFLQTSGKVISAGIQGELGKRRLNYKPYIVYKYKVNEAAYQNDSYSIYYANPRKTVVEKLIKDYQPGTRIDVYYDPGKPSNSVLKTGLEFINISAMILTELLLIIALAEIFSL